MDYYKNNVLIEHRPDDRYAVWERVRIFLFPWPTRWIRRAILNTYEEAQDYTVWM